MTEPASFTTVCAIGVARGTMCAVIVAAGIDPIAIACAVVGCIIMLCLLPSREQKRRPWELGVTMFGSMLLASLATPFLAPVALDIVHARWHQSITGDSVRAATAAIIGAGAQPLFIGGSAWLLRHWRRVTGSDANA